MAKHLVLFSLTGEAIDHELIEASDLIAIAERAQGIAYRPPGT